MPTPIATASVSAIAWLVPVALTVRADAAVTAPLTSAVVPPATEAPAPKPPPEITPPAPPVALAVARFCCPVRLDSTVTAPVTATEPLLPIRAVVTASAVMVAVAYDPAPAAIPMETTRVVALAAFSPAAFTSRLPPWTRPLASARTPPAMVADGIITEMLIPPTLPPFDSAAALLCPVAETPTAPADVTEPALVISAVTSAALVTWASDEAPEPVNRPRESASAFAVAVLVPVAVMATEPEAAIVPLTEASTAPWTRAVGRETPMPSPKEAAPASDCA